MYLKSRVGVGIEPTDIAFGVKGCGPPDPHFSTRSNHGIDPINRTFCIQLLGKSEQLAQNRKPCVAVIEDA